MASPVNVKLPDASAVTVALAARLNVTVAPAPPVTGLIAPEMLKVWAVAVKVTPEVTSALFMVTFKLAGVNVYPVCVGVTV